MKRMRRILFWCLTLCHLGFACTQATQAAILVSAPRDLPILKRLNLLDVSLAVLENGSFAVAGLETIEEPRQPSSAQILVQFFGADGAPKGEPIVVVTNEQSCDGGIGSLGDRYFLTWRRSPEQKTEAAFYDAEGVPLGEPFPWPDSEIRSYDQAYRYGPAPASRLLPFFYHEVGVNTSGNPIFQPTLQVFDKRAQALGPPFALVPPRRLAFVEDAAVNGSGRFILLEDQCPLAPSSPPKPCPRGVQVFDKGGRPKTAFSTENIPQYSADRGKSNSTGSVAIDANGNFLLLWIYDVFGRVRHLVARLYDREGRPLSGIIPVRDATNLSFRSPHALSNGEILIPWLLYPPAAPTDSLYLQELQTSNQRLLPPVLVASDIDDFRLIELNSSGHGVIAWTTADAGGRRSGAKFALFTVTSRAASSGTAEPEDENVQGRDEP